MLLLLFLSFPLLEHASLLIVQTIVFVEYHKRILFSFYSVYIGFGILIFFFSVLDVILPQLSLFACE